MDERAARLIEAAERESRLTAKELVFLLENGEAEEALAAAADRVRRKVVGDGIYLRGLIEFSNFCRRDCFYCGIRAGNLRAVRYRLTEEEIVRLAEKAKAYGYRTVVLQSGEDPYFTVARLTPILARIKDLGLVITLSVGERSAEEYRALKQAGADRFLLRIETTDSALYERLHPKMSYRERLRCLGDLRDAGFEVGTGCLVGLPQQSVRSLAEDILFFQAIDADMVGIGPFLPHGDTPLGTFSAGDFHLTRRMVSLIRLLLPEANIPATTAMETLCPNGRARILSSGANVVMPNVTEGEARKNYALYPGKAGVSDCPEDTRRTIAETAANIGRFIADDWGFRKRRRD